MRTSGGDDERNTPGSGQDPWEREVVGRGGARPGKELLRLTLPTNRDCGATDGVFETHEYITTHSSATGGCLSAETQLTLTTGLTEAGAAAIMISCFFRPRSYLRGKEWPGLRVVPVNETLAGPHRPPGPRGTAASWRGTARRTGPSPSPPGSPARGASAPRSPPPRGPEAAARGGRGGEARRRRGPPGRTPPDGRPRRLRRRGGRPGDASRGQGPVQRPLTARRSTLPPSGRRT